MIIEKTFAEVYLAEMDVSNAFAKVSSASSRRMFVIRMSGISICLHLQLGYALSISTLEMVATMCSVGT